MHTNVGDVDRTVRILVGIAIAAAGVYFRSYWGFVAAMPFLTAAFAWCPLYNPFRIDTREQHV